MNYQQIIRQLAQTGKPIIDSTRATRSEHITFDDFLFVPAQLTKRPVDYFREKITSETIIGKLSKHPITLDIPIMISAMSFGALSWNAKLALAKASTLTGTVANTGEGGMIQDERDLAKYLISQYSTGRFGVDNQYLASADAVEVKIGQGAKPGQGGLLPADKITPRIAEIRKVKIGEDCHSPAYHTDIHNIHDLRDRIEWIKQITGRKPVLLKLGPGHVEQDIALAVESGCDTIVFDGKLGGTAAAPRIMLEEVGVPLIPSIAKARRVLDEMGAKQELVVGGGLNTAGDVAKCLALGADAVIMASACLIAMGCVVCRQCYKGKCPVGITCQEPEYEKKLAPNASELVANFLKATTEEVKMIAGACGHNNIHSLSKLDMIALSKLASKTTGVKLF
jgi:glutamate synthase domain-containing protein 2